MSAKDMIKKGTGILVVVIMAIMMVNTVPSLGDVDDLFSASSSTEWENEAGTDTINIEYLTSSSFTDLEGFIAWNGTDSSGTWVSQSYAVSGEETSAEFEYRAVNDSDVKFVIRDTDSNEVIYETNLTATDGVKTQTVRTAVDNATHSNYRVEFEMTQQDAEVYSVDVQGESGNLSKTIAGFVIPLLLLGAIGGALYEMS